MWGAAIPTVVFAVLALMNAAVAQDWPTRPLTMVVAYAAGGPLGDIAPLLPRAGPTSPILKKVELLHFKVDNEL